MMTNTKVQFWEVGGCVRDEILGLRTKDIDFSVVGPESFEQMQAILVAEGFKIHKVDEDKFTIVCGVPKSKPELLARTKDADFVWARKESSERVRRSPVWIKPGTLADDLARRDFTANAIARDPHTGDLIDPHGGIADIEARLLRFVGDPFQRIEEDALRIVRGFRFLIMKKFDAEPETWAALTSDRAADLLDERDEDGKRVISVDRFQKEWERTFLFDTLGTLRLLSEVPERTREALFPEGLRLTATMMSKR